MLGRGPHTCECSTPTSCLVPSRRVVRHPVFLSFTVRCRTERNTVGFQAVSHGVLTDWEYMDVIRLAADAKCSSNLVNSISTIDRVLKFRHLRGPLKKLFGLGGLESDQDFVSVLTVGHLFCISDSGVEW